MRAGHLDREVDTVTWTKVTVMLSCVCHVTHGHKGALPADLGPWTHHPMGFLALVIITGKTKREQMETEVLV